MACTLTSIAFKTEKRGKMNEVVSANVTCETGVENDILGRPSKRQITVMSSEQWQQACDDIKAELPWLTRRANLLISGYQFSAADVGKTLTIGKELSLLITGETDPCRKMDLSHQGLEQALTPQWRAGVTCKVLRSGKINAGDSISII